MKALTRLTCLLAPCLLTAMTTAGAIDLGEASVMSQQGQRLKVAIPYGSAPGERVPALRFSVASATSADGRTVLSPDGFTVSKPARRNIVFLQSAEPVHARHLKVVVQVADGQPVSTSYDLQVPPASFTAISDAAPGQAAGVAPGKGRRPVRKSPRVKPSGSAAQTPGANAPGAAAAESRPAGLG